MSESLPSVKISPNVWVDLYAATGITVGSKIIINNIGSSEVRLTERASKPPNSGVGFNEVLERQTVVSSDTPVGAWAKSFDGTTLQVEAVDTSGFAPYTSSSLRQFGLEVARGNVPGMSSFLILGYTNNLTESKTSTIWDGGGLYTHLAPGGETLYISSSSAADTAVVVAVPGKDENYIPQVGVVTTNGQTQVEIQVAAAAALWIAVDAASSGGSAIAPEGTLYIATAGTLTGGVPDDPTTIKAIVPLSPLAGDIGTRVASQGISHNAIYTVPAGHQLAIYDITGRSKKDQHNFMAGSIIAFGGSAVQRNPIPVYQGGFDERFDVFVILEEKTIAEFVGSAEPGSGTSFANIAAKCILIDNSIVPVVTAQSLMGMC